MKFKTRYPKTQPLPLHGICFMNLSFCADEWNSHCFHLRSKAKRTFNWMKYYAIFQFASTYCFFLHVAKWMALRFPCQWTMRNRHNKSSVIVDCQTINVIKIWTDLANKTHTYSGKLAERIDSAKNPFPLFWVTFFDSKVPYTDKKNSEQRGHWHCCQPRIQYNFILIE